MWNNNFKIARRTIKQDFTYSGINILGLSLGLAACLLVGTVVLDELSYDGFWSKKERLYRILTVQTSEGVEGKMEVSYVNLGAMLRDNFPEVEASARVSKYESNFRLEENSTETIRMNLISADTSVWEMLDFTVLQGTPNRYNAGIGNLIISEEFSNSHFKGESPVGKIIFSVSPYEEKARPFLITGVIKNIPSNTYLRADGIHVSLPSTRELSREGWGFYDEQLILINSDSDIASFKEKANEWYSDFVTDASEDVKKSLPTFEFQPIDEIYLNSEFSNQSVKGSRTNVYVFSGVSLLLLVIACINYVNLSAARAVRRIRETGVRKVLGAGRRQLIYQFLFESILFFVIAAIFSSSIYALSLIQLEQFLGHRISVNLLSSWVYFLTFVAGVILLSIVAGLYPAFMISGFGINNALKNRFGSGSFSTVSGLRKALVTAQFVFALLVLIGTVTVWRQMQFIGQMDLGYNPTRVLSVSFFSTDGKAESLKQEISQMAGVESVSISGWVPTQGSASMTKQIPNPHNPEQMIPVHFILSDTELPEVLGFSLEKGRFFDERENKADFDIATQINPVLGKEEDEEKIPSSVLLTASTAKLLGIEELNEFHPQLEAIPIGIISDFHSISLRDPIKPTVLMATNEHSYASLLIKVKSEQEAGVLNDLTKLWTEFYPAKPIEFSWVDDLVQDQYQREQTQSTLLTFFGTLMLFLAGMGVFGLVVHATEQRIKEIGLRRVLGASQASILRLFSMDYLRLVGLALVISSPLAWYGMSRWLEEFAYHIELEWWIFAAAGLLASATALATVGSRVLWTTGINPANSLRSE